MCNKLSGLQLFIDRNSRAVLGLCKTEAHPELPDSLFCNSKYKAFRKDHNMFGGGASLLVHHSLFVEVALSGVICADIKISGVQYHVILCHRSPYYLQDDVTYFELSMQALSDPV
jgi:hypothetical protein